MKKGGYTLIEVLVAIVILSVIVIMSYSIVEVATNISRQATAAEDLQGESRDILGLLSSDIKRTDLTTISVNLAANQIKLTYSDGSTRIYDYNPTSKQLTLTDSKNPGGQTINSVWVNVTNFEMLPIGGDLNFIKLDAVFHANRSCKKGCDLEIQTTMAK